MVFKKIPSPLVTFNRFGQIIFVFKEVTKIAFKINPKILISVFVLNALWGLSSVPAFYLEKLVLDNLASGIGSPNLQSLIYPIGFLVFLRLLLELARNVVSNIVQFLRGTLSRLFSSELEVIMGKKIANLDIATIEDPDFKNRFNKVEREAGERAWAIMWPLSNILNYLVGFTSALVVLFFLHPAVAVGVFLVSIPAFVVDSRMIRLEYELDTKLSPLYRVWGWLSYYLVRNRNFLEMKILNLSNYLANKLKDIQKSVIYQHFESKKTRELYRFISYFPLTLFEFGASIWLIGLVLVKRITIGSFEFYIRTLRSAQSNLSAIVSSFLEIYENYIYVNDLIWFLNLSPKINLKAKGEKLNYSSTTIEFKSVWFRYREDQPWILKDLNFRIERGDRIAIIGENGAGKSTLIKLLARFYDPQKGDVYVNGINLKELDLRDWWKHLAILFQKFETYPFTVRESIGYGDVKRVEKLFEIKEAALKTGIDSYIEELPLRYENPLAPEFDKGVDPSIGEWQRIGISRMLFRNNAKVLIMDEPTSNVDPEAEENIFKELMKITRNKILIFVTQRFSTVRIADKIFVLHKGKIVEEGTHNELMKLNGKYARLYNLQAKGYQ